MLGIQCDHTDNIDTASALLLCPEFALKVTHRSFLGSPWIPASFCLQRGLSPALRGPGLSLGKTGYPRTKATGAMLTTEGQGIIGNTTRAFHRVPVVLSPCCPGSNPLMNIFLLAVLPPCLTSLLPHALGFQSLS